MRSDTRKKDKKNAPFRPTVDNGKVNTGSESPVSGGLWVNLDVGLHIMGVGVSLLYAY